MRILLLLSLLFVTTFSFAQKKLLVIRANSKKAFIIEGKDDRYPWGISPGVKPDVHTISKSVKPKWVRFYTDIDSIKVKIKPNEKFDFIVLLNGKDSCYTRIESLPVKNFVHQMPESHDTIPFVLTSFNNIIVKGILNGIDTLQLNFDTGTTGLLLTNDAIKNKTHLGKNTANNNTLSIGKLSWGSLPVYDVELSGQESDGRFGWDLFDGKVVEIDYDKNIIIVHSKLSKIDKTYSRFPVEYTQGVLCIYGVLRMKNQQFKSRFLFDSGYQRTIMLDTVLMNEQHYPKELDVIKKVVMHNGQGKVIPVFTVNNEKLILGKHELVNIPVQLLATANPAKFKTHILGNEVLKRFNTILDFQNNVVYLKPNGLVGLAYSDAK